jgi:hypothetical protein
MTTELKTSSRVIASLIEQSKGKIVSVDFIKNNGEFRNLVGRMEVRKNLSGGVRTTDPNEYICIYDMQNKGYRSINKNQIIALRTQGLEIVNTKG